MVVCFFLSILVGGLAMKAVGCVGEMKDWPVILKLIPNTLCQKEAAKHEPERMVVIKEPLNEKRTPATTSQDAQLNFIKLFEVTIPK